MNAECLANCPLVARCHGEIRRAEQSSRDIIELEFSALDATAWSASQDALAHDDRAAELREKPTNELARQINSHLQKSGAIYRKVREEAVRLRKTKLPHNDSIIEAQQHRINEITEACQDGPRLKRQYKLFGAYVMKCSHSHSR